MNAIEIQNVTKIFPDKTMALEDVSFSIKEGSFTVIAGSNGSGKSVLMSLIAKLDEPTKGKIITKSQAGLVFQDADAQILGETVEEDVAFGAKNCGLRKNELVQRIDSSLNAAGLMHKKSSPSRTLSGGEKRRLAVAGILAMNRDIFIFDEPYANLDWPGVKQVNEILIQLKNEKKTIIVLTHELEKVLSLADTFIILDKGRIRFDGTVEDGLKENLEQWSIRNPLAGGMKKEDLVWL